MDYRWRVEVLRKTQKLLGGCRQRPPNRLVECNPDGKLDQQRPSATQGAYPGLLVDLGHLLLELSLILAILLLDLLEFRCKRLHRPGGTQLPQGEGQHEKTDNDNQNNDGHSKATEKGAGQKNEKIEYRLKQEEIPNLYRPICRKNGDNRNSNKEYDNIPSTHQENSLTISFARCKAP